MVYEAKKFYVNLTPKATQYENYDIKYWNYYTDIKYALIKYGDNNWVATYRPELHADINGIYFTSWCQGHYFESKNSAIEYIKDKYISLIADKIDELEDLKDELNNID